MCFKKTLTPGIYMKKILILLIINVLQSSYKVPVEFRDEFRTAIRFLKEKEPLIQKTSKKYQSSANEALCIVAPELIRYNLFRDFFETKALESLYVVFGKEGADFSIGHFQMKPSFIESLEFFVKKDSDLSNKFENVIRFNEHNETGQRKERIKRLKNFEWQLQYAFCFYEVMQKEYVDCGFSDFKEGVKILFHSI